jgi:hypothetical protein
MTLTLTLNPNDLTPTELAALRHLMQHALSSSGYIAQAIDDIDDAGEANCGDDFAGYITQANEFFGV